MKKERGTLDICPLNCPEIYVPEGHQAFKDNDYLEIDGIIYLSCYIKTASSYFIVNYDDGTIRMMNKARLQEEDWTPFNKGVIGKLISQSDGFVTYTDCRPEEADYITEGVGNGLAIFDKESLTLLKAYYFKDVYNIDSPVEIDRNNTSKDYVVVHYMDETFVIRTKDASILKIYGTKVVADGKYLLTLPDDYYEGLSGLCLLNMESGREYGLSKLLSPIEHNQTLNGGNYPMILDLEGSIDAKAMTITLTLPVGGLTMRYNINEIIENQ